MVRGHYAPRVYAAGASLVDKRAHSASARSSSANTVAAHNYFWPGSFLHTACHCHSQWQQCLVWNLNGRWHIHFAWNSMQLPLVWSISDHFLLWHSDARARRAGIPLRCIEERHRCSSSYNTSYHIGFVALDQKSQ